MKMNQMSKQLHTRITTCLAVVSVLAWFFLSYTVASAATLGVSPSTGVYTAGGTFTARVSVNTAGSAINAADGTISFNPSELSVVRIQKGSVFNLWTAEPSFSNSAGTISFSGGNPTGYTGSNGTILSITFRAKNAGTSKVNFSSGSVLAADGRGTNVLTSMGGGTYTIAAAEVAPEPEVIEYVAPANTPGAVTISSPTHPDPETYHATTTAILRWDLPSDATGVRTLLDGNSGSIPTKVYSPAISEITIEELGQGVQYFHIQVQNDEGWGRVTHYRLAVDSNNPTDFSVESPDDADFSSPEQSFWLRVQDEGSKILRYLIQLDGAEPYEFIDTEETGQLALTGLTPGNHSMVIEAFDEAGNSIVATHNFIIEAFAKPEFTDYPNQIGADVIPVLKGTTRPNATVTVYVEQLGGETKTFESISDANGMFAFVPDERFTNGVYELWVVAVDQYGAQSEASQRIRIAVQEPNVVRIGNYVIDVLSVIIPLLALVIVFGFLVFYAVVRMRKLRGGVWRESEEALSVMHAEFKQLHDTLGSEANALAGTRKSGKLTKGEAELVDELTKQLKAAEKRVEKELEDIEEIVE